MNANAASVPDPTGPVGLPLNLGIVDPLGPSQPENVPTVQQPGTAPSQYPQFDTVDQYGWFGSGFARAGCSTCSPRRVAIAVGGDPNDPGTATTGGRIYVLSTITNQVFMYDLSNPPAITAMNAAPFNSISWSSTQAIAYYRTSVYILGVDGSTNQQVVRVFDRDGNYQRSIQLNHQIDEGITGPISNRYSGLAVAFGEIWLTHAGSSDADGQDVVVYDAATGAYKGRSQQLPGAATSPSYRSWWNIQISPELSGAIVDRRFFQQGPLVASDAVPYSPECTYGIHGSCYSGEQRGTNAVWGMRWFMELAAPAGNDTYIPVQEFSIDQQTIGSTGWPFSLLPGGGFSVGLPGYYLTPQRTWLPMQEQQGDPASLSDLFFNNRATRIDWSGYPTTSSWLRGQNQCLKYMVSDGDIFIVGDKGERWYQPARGFQQIQFLIDGNVVSTLTGTSNAFGTWCIPGGTSAYSDGTHTLEAIATVDNGKQVTKTNSTFRIDNTPPTGGIVTSLGTYSRASVNVAGTMSDASSGPYDWQLQITPTGQSNWTTIPGCNLAANPSGAYTCPWDTTKYGDGGYTIRAQLRDSAIDSNGNVGNTAYVAAGSTTVDNTPPTFDSPLPSVGSDTPIIQRSPTLIDFNQSDATSGVAQTTLEWNTATDGSENGSWTPANAAATGDTPMGATMWDTSGVPSGLHRMRATTTDRAGNSRVTKFQVVISNQHCQYSPSDSATYCYAGAGNSQGTGVSAVINPNVNPQVQDVSNDPKGNDEYSSDFIQFAHHGKSQNPAMELGTVRDTHECDSAHWMVQAVYTISDTQPQITRCKPGRTFSSKFNLVKRGQRYEAAWQAQPQSHMTLLLSINAKDKKRNVIDEQARGETDWPGRQISGAFSSPVVHDGNGWHPPNWGLFADGTTGGPGTVAAGNYAVAGTPTSFCVFGAFGPGIGCP
jgi:hypothetical protein